MNEREQLLACIADIEVEAEAAKIYGDHWRIHDWMARRSHAAGIIGKAVKDLARAEAKAKHRPGSIGARKARQKAKAARRKIRQLERVIAEPFTDYRPGKPEYMAEGLSFISDHKPAASVRRIWKGNGLPEYTIE